MLMAKKTTLKKSTKSKNYTKNNAWFIQVRGSYLPNSWQAWLSYIPFVAYLVFSLIVAFDYTGNNVKAILWIVPNWVAAAVIMTWIAKQTS